MGDGLTNEKLVKKYLDGLSNSDKMWCMLLLALALLGDGERKKFQKMCKGVFEEDNDGHRVED